MITTNSKFAFIMANQCEAIAPVNTEVYVHFADTGSGKMQIHGKILRVDQEETESQEKKTTELGWVRTDVEIKANEPDLFNLGHEAVRSELEKINPEVNFSIV